MIKHLKESYRRCPIMNDYGCGMYSYTLICVDFFASCQYRYEIRANSLDEALLYASQFLDSDFNFKPIESVLEVYFSEYPYYISYLFI